MNKKELLWKKKLECADKSVYGFDGMIYKQRKNKPHSRPIEVHFKLTHKFRIYLEIVFRYGEFYIRVKVFDATNTISLKNKPIMKANIKYRFKNIADIIELKNYL